MNRLKEKYIKLLVSAKKPQWKPDDKIKVAIAVNQYFTPQRWSVIFEDYLDTEIINWDVIFCHNKFDVYRHVPFADVCFIFGLGDFLLKQIITQKMIYFPLLGLEFLKDKTLPENIIIGQPLPYSAQSIAEYCVAMSIALTRNLHNSFENRFAKRWKQNNIIPQSVVSITRCKIGVLGLGRVGKVIAENFKNIGCKVIGCDNNPPQNCNAISAFYTSDKLYDFIKKIDILIISIPLNESTKKLINLRALQVLGKDKYLINVSRGEIIDEQALIQALSTNAIRGAALDVFEHEPLPRNSALYRCKNIIITPHIAGNINLFVNEIQQDFISKALAYSKNV